MRIEPIISSLRVGAGTNKINSPGDNHASGPENEAEGRSAPEHTQNQRPDQIELFLHLQRPGMAKQCLGIPTKRSIPIHKVRRRQEYRSEPINLVRKKHIDKYYKRKQ